MLLKHALLCLIFLGLYFNTSAMHKSKKSLDSKNIFSLTIVAEKLSDIITTKYRKNRKVLISIDQVGKYLLDGIKLIDENYNRGDRSYISFTFPTEFFNNNYEEFNTYYKEYLANNKVDKEAIEDQDTQFIIIGYCNNCSSKNLQYFINFLEYFSYNFSLIYFIPRGISPLTTNKYHSNIRFSINPESDINKLMLKLNNSSNLNRNILAKHISNL